ncbi:MAG TPA: 2,4-diaminopentanoate dehydrogenase [Synergistales bacterium]|nr:2,4-diaminopentanoate dehydrogenase [Synergistales bacterium]
MKPTKIVLWGVGAMGSGIARVIGQKAEMQVVGAIEADPRKVGLPLSDFTGVPEQENVPVSCSLEELPNSEPDLFIVATASRVKDVFQQVMAVLDRGLPVITTAEEMAYPWKAEPGLCAEMDKAAKEKGVAVLGTGINPGFVMDLLPVVLSAACTDVKRIRVTRVNDLSPFGPTVLREQGVGLTAEEFARKVEEGSLEGHVGFLQSIAMISDALGLGVDRIEQFKEPIVSSVRREEKGIVVNPGQVAGCSQTGIGYRKGEPVVELIHPQQIHPHLEGVATGDTVELFGTPDIRLEIRPEIPGGTGTIALAVNSIPLVLKARPGLLTLLDLPLPHAIR